jgi:hypothetical protein
LTCLGVADVLLSLQTQKLLDSLPPRPPSFLCCGQKRTQTLDIAHTVSLCMARVCDKADLHTAATVAQSDRGSFYDSIPAVSVCRLMVSLGCCPWLAAACLMFTLLPTIVFTHGDVVHRLGQRTAGALTGTRVCRPVGSHHRRRPRSVDLQQLCGHGHNH